MNKEVNKDPFEILCETLKVTTDINGTKTISATFWGVELERKVIGSEVARGGIGFILEQMYDEAVKIVDDLGSYKRVIGVLPRIYQTMTPAQLDVLAGNGA